MEALERVLEFISDVFDIVEQFLLGLVAKSATWLSPMIPAIFIYSSVKSLFPSLPESSEYLIAYVIEALGLTTIMNTMDGWQQWQTERTRTRFWALVIAGATALFYVVINILLVIVLKARPDWASWGVGLLSIVSVIAGVTTMMRVWQSQRNGDDRRIRRKREAEQRELHRMDIERRQQEFALELDLRRAQAAQKLEIERQKAEAKLSKGVANSVAGVVAKNVAPSASTLATPTDATGRRNVLTRLLQQYGDIGDTAFSRQLGVDRTTVYRDFKALEKAGVVHVNGNGRELTNGHNGRGA